MKDIVSNIPIELSDVWIPNPEVAGANLREIDDIEYGLQSRVELMSLPDASNEVVVLKRMGVQKGLEHAEAVLLQNRLAPYREGLVAHGWSVPVLAPRAWR